MDPLTLNLNDSRADLATVGGKGLSLTKMINAGLPVPSGFHVTTEAYRLYVAHNGLQAQIFAEVAPGREVFEKSFLEGSEGTCGT